jgi:hypothetical protein
MANGLSARSNNEVYRPRRVTKPAIITRPARTIRAAAPEIRARGEMEFSQRNMGCITFPREPCHPSVDGIADKCARNRPLLGEIHLSAPSTRADFDSMRPEVREQGADIFMQSSGICHLPLTSLPPPGRHSTLGR